MYLISQSLSIRTGVLTRCRFCVPHLIARGLLLGVFGRKVSSLKMWWVSFKCTVGLNIYTVYISCTFKHFTHKGKMKVRRTKRGNGRVGALSGDRIPLGKQTARTPERNATKRFPGWTPHPTPVEMSSPARIIKLSL